jgi:hypothetical protein
LGRNSNHPVLSADDEITDFMGIPSGSSGFAVSVGVGTECPHAYHHGDSQRTYLIDKSKHDKIVLFRERVFGS